MEIPLGYETLKPVPHVKVYASIGCSGDYDTRTVPFRKSAWTPLMSHGSFGMTATWSASEHGDCRTTVERDPFQIAVLERGWTWILRTGSHYTHVVWGESQRIRLASQFGSNLTRTIYVLDEPTIGLHPYNTNPLS